MPIKVKGTEIVDDNRNIKNADGSQITGIVTSITAGPGVTVNQSTGNVTISADTSDTYWKKDAVGIAATYKVGIATTASSDGSLTIKDNLIFRGTNVKIGNRAGECYSEAVSTGDHQVLIGTAAGRCSFNDCSKLNVYLGYYAGNRRCSANNVAIGYLAHGTASTFTFQGRNVAIGQQAHESLICGCANVAVGGFSGRSWCYGSRNTFVGAYSGQGQNSSGTFLSENTFIGACSGRGLSNFGCNNTFIGVRAGEIHTGSCNVAIGRDSSCKITGSNNVSIGHCSLNEVCGSNNIAIGSSSGRKLTSNSTNNVFIGHDTANDFSGGSSSVFIGAYSGKLVNSGSCRSVFIGKDSGCNGGQQSVYIGSGAGACCSGFNNTFIGYYAGRRPAFGACGENTLIGFCAGEKLWGGYNVVIGSNSLKDTCDYSNRNVVIGNDSLITCYYYCDSVVIGSGSSLSNSQFGAISIGNSIGSGGSIVIGHCANRCNSSVSIAIGNSSAFNNGTRTSSVFIGNLSNCAGSSAYSVSVGDCSIMSGTGDYNMILGYKAGCHSNHACSVILGYNAGNSATCTGACNINNIIIGANAGVSTTSGLIDIADKDNHIIIGNNDTVAFYTKLSTGVCPGLTVKWDPVTFELAADTSSRRFKTNIRPFLGGIKETLELNPVIYNSIEEPEGRDIVGFIAEEVDETGLKEFVVYDKNNDPLSVSYDKMVVLLTNAVKDLYEENKKIKERLSTLENLVKNHLENHA